MTETTTNSRTVLWVIVGLVAVVGVFVGTALSSGTGDAVKYEIEAFGEPTVSGSLPPLPSDSGGVQLDDAAAGLAVPEMHGKDYFGNDVSIVNDGQPKIIMFLAHWCSHCQAEVPRISARLAGAAEENGVAWYGIATSSNRTRGNWSPAAWLDASGLKIPVIMDDVDSSLLRSYGIGSFPGWAVVASDGTLIARATGELPSDAVDALVALAASS